MKELRCIGTLKNGKRCARLLGKFESVNGEIKCPNSKCGQMNIITTKIESSKAPYVNRLNLTKK